MAHAAGPQVAGAFDGDLLPRDAGGITSPGRPEPVRGPEQDPGLAYLVLAYALVVTIHSPSRLRHAAGALIFSGSVINLVTVVTFIGQRLLDSGAMFIQRTGTARRRSSVIRTRTADSSSSCW
jgi:hypothetical protein